jgi:hypothetical protein
MVKVQGLATRAQIAAFEVCLVCLSVRKHWEVPALCFRECEYLCVCEK